MNTFFVVDNLSNSELSYDLITAINDEKDLSCNIYFQNHAPPIIDPECLTLNITGLASAKGLAVAFDLASALTILNANCNVKNIIYLYNLEWLQQSMDYMLIRKILDNFDIYSRSESHIPIIQNLTNGKDVKFVPDMKEFFKCLKSQK